MVTVINTYVKKIARYLTIRDKYRAISIAIFFLGILMATVSFLNLLPSNNQTTRYSYEQQGFKDSAIALVKMVGSADKALQDELVIFFQALQLCYSEAYYIDERHVVFINGIPTPRLMNGTKQVNLDKTIPDHFLHSTGAASTIFVRQGDEFIRISTSIKERGNKRAVGTYLEHDNPAYEKILNGKEYTGPAEVFDQQYMAKYSPIFNENGKVIGALFLGIDIVEQLSLQEI